jgi:maltooligosyltrehalose trehalohydrolase
VDFGQVGQLAKAFGDVYVYEGQYSTFRQRRQGRPVGALPASRFVCCLQDHDQVGNRALGERMAQLVGPELLRVGAALVLLAPFVPMLFQGEEWGAATPFLYFTDHADPALGESVREGRRREHPAQVGAQDGVVEAPDPQSLSAFRRSKLDWSEPVREPHRSLLGWYRDLIALRQREPDLHRGDRGSLNVSYDEEARWLVVRRGSFLIAANFAEQQQAVPLWASDGGTGSIVLASAPATSLVDEAGCWCAVLSPCSVAVVKRPTGGGQLGG